MPIRIDNQVTNALNVPIMLSNNYINRPTAGIFGRLFISIDTYQIYQDRVSGWSLIADAGAGSGNLQSITANGNTTTYGINIQGGATLSVYGLTNGSVLFPSGGSGEISQDNANFFWDNTNKRLGLGTASPGARLDVHSSTNVTAQFNGTGVTNAILQFQNAGTSKWSIGNYYNSGNNDLIIYDTTNTIYRAFFTNTGYAIFNSNVIIGSTNRSSSYGLDVYSSAYFRGSVYNLNYTQGSVLFAGAGGLITQSNSQFFWDNTNNRLGIGTTAPDTKLEIQVAASNAFTGTGYRVATFSATTAAAADRPGIILGYDTAGGGIIAPATQSGVTNFLAFWTYNSGWGERMRIKSGGELLLNTTTTFFGATGRGTFEMNGSNDCMFAQKVGDVAQAYMYASATQTEIYSLNKLRLSGGNVIINSTTDNGHKLQVTGQIDTLGSNSAVLWQDTGAGVNWTFYAAGSVFRFSNTAAGIVANISQTTGVYTPTSDINKKKDFELSTIGLDAILGLKSTLYRMKKDDENIKKHLGFIAQEVKEFIPQAYVENNDFIGLDYQAITSTIVKAIQELNEKLVRNNIN